MCHGLSPVFLPDFSGLFKNGKIHATMRMMVDIREHHDRAGRSPFGEWFDKLNSEASRKVTTALYRVGLGNFSHTKGVGGWRLRMQDQFRPWIPRVFRQRR